jgi:putative peptidoglycan lipid II flippase
MALGTLASRGTGFLRTLMLVYALGVVGVANSYNNANTLPNAVYDLMLGGILTSVVVPLLVAAAKRDADRGEAYDQRMFTLATIALAVLTVLATLAAPLLVNLYAHALTGPERHLTVIFAFFFIPQIFFYGVSSLAGGVLNARGRFAAPMWTPVINNIVVILVLLLFIATGGIGVHPGDISTAQIQLLGFGTTLGIIAQTAAMIPALHRAGFRWRPRFDFRRAEVTEIRRMAAPLLGYVLTTQVSFLVVLHLQLCMAAVPDAVRHHRHLGDHRAAAPDERARRRASPAAGPQRLLHRGPAVLGGRGARRPAAHRARRAAG